jgi:hypothetical protein
VITTSTLRTTKVLLLLATQAYANSPLVDAVGQVESGMNHQAVGRDGERGAWQMRLCAWIDAETVLKERWHYSYAHDKGIARRHAEAYLTILTNGLRKHLRREPTVQEIYASYRLGLTGFKRFKNYSKIPADIRDSCERVANLTK